MWRTLFLSFGMFLAGGLVAHSCKSGLDQHHEATGVKKAKPALKGFAEPGSP